METRLFDSMGREVQPGDRYIVKPIKGCPTAQVYEIYMRNGCLCGGITQAGSQPLGWEINENGDHEMEEHQWFTDRAVVIETAPKPAMDTVTPIATY